MKWLPLAPICCDGPFVSKKIRPVIEGLNRRINALLKDRARVEAEADRVVRLEGTLKCIEAERVIRNESQVVFYALAEVAEEAASAKQARVLEMQASRRAELDLPPQHRLSPAMLETMPSYCRLAAELIEARSWPRDFQDQARRNRESLAVLDADAERLDRDVRWARSEAKREAKDQAEHASIVAEQHAAEQTSPRNEMRRRVAALLGR